jgi:hypothetical protein
METKVTKNIKFINKASALFYISLKKKDFVY